MSFSPSGQYKDKTVLLTGGLGFLGSVVLERLLRLTEVKAVFLLVRSKRHVSAGKRVENLLSSPLFHLLHIRASSSVFSKVQAVEGDLAMPGLGLCAADAQKLKDSVDILIHCAANVQLEADVQQSFRDNYLSTKALMAVASEMSHLKAFVHTSTFFVNNYLPRNSLVKECIYPMPLLLGGEELSHEQYVEAMLAMPADEANKRTATLMQSLNFTSTYAFGKHLTEQLVNSTVIKPGVGRAIVRPSLISSVAQDPYPGYISGYAGSPGYTMGYACGFFQGVKSVAYGSDTILDLIPCDTVANVVITAAAAAAASYGSASADKAAVIYHAASSQSHPYPLGEAFDKLSRFWKANPAPLRLPATSYVKVKGEHNPTTQGIERARQQTALKIRLVSGLLRLAGKGKEAHILKKSFEAFNVQNTLAYNRSMICAVDNVRAVQARMTPEARQAWQVVWEPSIQSWDVYSYTFLAGVRCLLFRMNQKIRKVPHLFEVRQAGRPVLSGPSQATSLKSPGTAAGDSASIADSASSSVHRDQQACSAADGSSKKEQRALAKATAAAVGSSKGDLVQKLAAKLQQVQAAEAEEEWGISKLEAALPVAAC